MKRHVLSFTSALLLAASAAAADPAYLTVGGDATVSAPPDAVTINAGVTSQGKTAKAALDANSRAMGAVFAAMKAQGIADRDIRTTNLNLEPEYAPVPAGNVQNFNDRPIIGYRVSNNVNVTIEDTAKAGTVLDSLVQAGANQTGGVSYVLRNDKEALAEARAAAVKDAFARAQIYAATAGVTLGPIHAISDTEAVPVTPRFETLMVAGSKIAPPMSGGEQTVRAAVTVSWEIKQ